MEKRRKEAVMMNSFFENNVTAIFEGVVAGLGLLVLNAVGHQGFGGPEIPYVYGLALALAVIVAAIRSHTHPHDDHHLGA
jgi:Mg/Co/Ni transporter MgtE